jgi:predicted RNA binding protein YcfA (HicA-like mRNA interferase family)
MKFREFERQLRDYGFELKRTSGSHRIYVHPKVPRPLSVQPIGNEAKAYQVRQLMAMIEEFELVRGRKR